MLIDAGLRDKKEKPIRNKIKKNIKSKAKSHADKVQVTFHTLRHTFATRAIEQGMEIPVLSKIDTHTGAFAVIFGGLYLILYAAACTELDEGSALLTAIGFILSRALSGLSTATFPEARKHGMLADFMKDARKKTVAVCMLVIFFLAAFLELLFGGICGGVVVITTVLIFLWYRHMAVQEFGGVTGDLAGFFLQICELGILLAAVIGKAVF